MMNMVSFVVILFHHSSLACLLATYEVLASILQTVLLIARASSKLPSYLSYVM